MLCIYASRYGSRFSRGFRKGFREGFRQKTSVTLLCTWAYSARCVHPGLSIRIPVQDSATRISVRVSVREFLQDLFSPSIERGTVESHGVHATTHPGQ